MAWNKPSPELIELLVQTVEEEDFDCQRRTMFGCPTFFSSNGQMFAGVFQDTIMLRLSEADRDRIFEEEAEVMPFEPMEGRVMKEYVTLPASVYEKKEIFREWLKGGHEYALTLPKKVKKSKKR